MSRLLHSFEAVDALAPEAVAGPGAVLPHADAGHTARLRAGESAALGEIYDLHHGDLRRFAVRLLGDGVAAEDLVHDVFLALPRALRGFRGDCTLRTFLMSVAVNHARKYVRAAGRRRNALARYAELPTARPLTADVDAERRQAVETLRTGLERLPLQQRIAFVLCEVEQHSAAEAARIMDVPEATARTRAFHARRKLRQWLEERA